MKRRNRTSRRTFLKQASAAVAVPIVIASSALGDDKNDPASERITMGAIGVGGRGSGNMRSLAGRKEVQMLAACDVVPDHRNRAKVSVDGQNSYVCDYHANPFLGFFRKTVLDTSARPRYARSAESLHFKSTRSRWATRRGIKAIRP